MYEEWLTSSRYGRPSLVREAAEFAKHRMFRLRSQDMLVHTITWAKKSGDRTNIQDYHCSCDRMQIYHIWELCNDGRQRVRKGQQSRYSSSVGRI